MANSDKNQALHVTGTADFQKEVIDSDVPVLVDFFAEWCGPCQMAAPIMDKLAGEYDGRAKVVKVDVDAEGNREIAMSHRVMSIPTVMVYADGEIAGHQIGFIGEDGYRNLIEGSLKSSGKAN